MTINLPFTDNNVSLPAAVACGLFTIGMVMAAQAGLWLINRWPAHAKLEQSNEVAGIVFGAIGLLYSLILAFVIVAVWDDYNDLEKTVEAETDKLNGILAHSITLPDSLKAVIGSGIYAYCEQVMQQEWQIRAANTNHPSAIPVLRRKLLNTEPKSYVQTRVFDAIDKDLSDVADLRRARLSHTHSQMPQSIWQILKAGTGLLILFSYFFQVPSVALKRVYLSFLVIAVSICMFLVYSLDHPFDGQDGISVQPYCTIRAESKALYSTLK